MAMNSFDSPHASEERILQALANLNRIGAAINENNASRMVDVQHTLKTIVESAAEVIPGAACVIYTYSPSCKHFDADSRVSTGERAEAVPLDVPRANGFGTLALARQKRVFSYEETGMEIHPGIAAAGAQVVACFPLIIADRPAGALYMYLFEARRFSRLEEMMLENFVNLAAMTISQAFRMLDITHDLARKEEELLHLRRTGLLISSRLKLEETLESILQMAMEITNARYGIFRLLDKDSGNLVTRAFVGDELTAPLVENLPVDEHSVMGWVCRNGQPALVYDLLASSWSGIYYPLDDRMQMRSELAVPLINAGGRVEGVLNLESPLVGAFSEQDKHLLQSLAAQAVTAIQEARLLDALQEAAQMLVFNPGQAVLDRLVQLACELLETSIAHIWLVEDDWLVSKAVHGSSELDRRLPLHESLTGQAVLSKSVILTDDLKQDSRFSRPDLAQNFSWKRALIIPLMVNQLQTPIGAFSVYSKDSDLGRFAESDWDKKILTCLGHYAVLAVQNSLNLSALKSAQEQQAVAETFAAVGDVAANLLHQLNNKIGTIPVRVQGIQDKCASLLPHEPYLAANLVEIERSANEAMTAVSENLAHLRPIHITEVDINGCVQDAMKAAQLPQTVNVYLAELTQLPLVIAGQRNLTLVFVNLFDNAVNAMQGSGEIRINGRVRRQQVEVIFSDNGPGIPQALHGKIFEFNYSGRNQAHPGKLGFGLWWTKTVMTRLGGSIAVESDGVHGTVFRLMLPLAVVKP